MKESEIKMSIIRSLRLFCPDVVFIIRIFSGKVESKWGGWVQGADPGTPDLLAILRPGVAVFIEVKSAKGRQSDDQKIFQHKIAGMANLHYCLARSRDDVIEYIKLNI